MSRHPRKSTATEVDGVRYRSAFEASVAADLAERGVPFQYEATQLCYEVPRVYVVDFDVPGGSIPKGERVVSTVSAHTVHVEVKGYFPREDRQKLLEAKRANPDRDIRIVFQNPRNKLTKAKRSMTYGQWADRHGFKWAKGSVPDEWLLGG